jgi:predicted DNA-binding mobile mystery protein A
MITHLPVTANRLLKQVTDTARRAPAELGSATPALLIKTIRQRLGMTQAQLARRAKIPQSHVATIEIGRADVQLGTIRRIVEALHCEAILLLKPKESFQEIIKERATKIATRRVSRVMGSMALENQNPDSKHRADLINAEMHRLIQHPRELWEED